MFGRVAILLSAVGFSIVGLVYVLCAQPAQAAYPCSGKSVSPSQNLAQVAENSPAGTTFCIHDGTYSISSPVRVDDSDRFIGLYDDSTRPAVVTSQAKQVFEASGSVGATIKGLKISGAVGGNYCEPGCGNGIRGGDNLTVADAWVTGNKNNGIGGAGAQLLVQDSIIDYNGSYSFSYLDGGSSSAAGIKGMRSMIISNSKIRNNYWNGVWCDGGCTRFEVHDSVLTGNGKAGIHYEISRGPAIVEGNAIQRNGVLAQANRPNGLLIVGSSNIDAYGNTFGDNTENGVHIAADHRGTLSNVKVHDNIRNGDSIKGCTLSGVSCYRN